MLGLGSALTTGSNTEQLYSITLDGTNDYINFGNVLDIGTGDFSISIWTKFSDATSHRLANKYEDANNTWELKTNSADVIMFNGKDGGTSFGSVSGAAAVTDLENTWVHICVTNDRDGNHIIYVNGTTDTYGNTGESMANASLDHNNDAEIWVGRVLTDYEEAFYSEFAMWDAVLDADAVAAIYNSGKPFDIANNRGNYDNSGDLTGYWRMNDGSGTVLVDNSGNGNNGALTNGATFSPDTPDD